MQDIVNTLPKLIKTKKQETAGISKSRWHCMYHWGTPQLVTIKSVWTMLALVQSSGCLRTFAATVLAHRRNLSASQSWLLSSPAWTLGIKTHSYQFGSRIWREHAVTWKVYFLFYHMFTLIFIQIILDLLIGKHLPILLTSSTCHLWKSLSSLYFYYKQLHQLSWHL